MAKFKPQIVHVCENCGADLFNLMPVYRIGSFIETHHRSTGRTHYSEKTITLCETCHSALIQKLGLMKQVTEAIRPDIKFDNFNHLYNKLTGKGNEVKESQAESEFRPPEYKVLVPIRFLSKLHILYSKLEHAGFTVRPIGMEPSTDPYRTAIDVSEGGNSLCTIETMGFGESKPDTLVLRTSFESMGEFTNDNCEVIIKPMNILIEVLGIMSLEIARLGQEK